MFYNFDTRNLNDVQGIAKAFKSDKAYAPIMPSYVWYDGIYTPLRSDLQVGYYVSINTTYGTALHPIDVQNIDRIYIN